MSELTPQQMAKRTGLSISTLHYYESIGLLDAIQRAPNGHRRYTADDVIRAEFLKHVRATGMSIEQMQSFVALHREGEATIEERLRLLAEHRTAVETQRDALNETLAYLDAKIEIVRKLRSHEHQASVEQG